MSDNLPLWKGVPFTFGYIMLITVTDDHIGTEIPRLHTSADERQHIRLAP